MSTKSPRAVRWGFMGKTPLQPSKTPTKDELHAIATGSIAKIFAKDLLVDPNTRGTADITHIVTAVASSSSIESAERFYKEIVQPCQASGAVCSTYGSYEQLVKDPAVDIIYISTPHSHHFQNCMLALHSGKAVLCEKPVTVNATQARKLCEVAKEKELFFMEAVWTRFFPLSIKIRQLIQEGVIGDVVQVFANNFVHTDIESLSPSHRYLNMSLAGGALLDIGVYSLAWLFQTLYHTQDSQSRRPPFGLSSLVEFHKPSGADRTATILMRFHMPSNSNLKVAHGIGTTSMDLCDANSESGPTIHIYGTKGEIQVLGPAYRPQSIKVTPKTGLGETYEQTFPIPAEGHGMFWEADEAARRWLAGELQSITIPWEETVAVMDTLDEIRKQAAIVYPDDIETTQWPVKLNSRH